MERKLEEEQKLREEQSAMMQSMVTWMQGLGASMNYATPPPPFALPAQPYLPQEPSSTHMSMQNQFMCFYLFVILTQFMYFYLQNQSWNASNDPPPDHNSSAAP